MRRVIGMAGVLAVACLSWATVGASTSTASFGIESFTGQVANADLSPATQAGGHPYSANATFRFNAHQETSVSGSATVPDSDVRDVDVDLPAGFIGNPLAVPTCDIEAMLDDLGFLCPAASQVGRAKLFLTGYGPDFANFYIWSPIYAIEPSYGVPAEFAFQAVGIVSRLSAEVRDDGTYGITMKSVGIPQKIGVVSVDVTLWGNPSDPSHDGERRECLTTFGPSGSLCPTTTPPIALLTNPVNCSAGLLTTTMEATSWSDPGVVATRSFDHDVNGEPIEVTGCDSVPFKPTMNVQTTTTQADSPTGLEFELDLPQAGLISPSGTATAHLKSATVQLPAGMSVAPAAAEGLVGCSPQQIGLTSKSPVSFDLEDPSCPSASRIGSVEVETPLIEGPLKGGVYLANQNDNAFDSLLSLYLVVQSKERGIMVKLAGKVEADPESGRLTASFDDNPQLPFDRLALKLNGGPRAALVTPPACGTYSTTASFGPWSGTPPVTQTDSFEIVTGPGGKPCPSGQFDPELLAGTANPLAGAFSPFVLRLSREDGTQHLGGLNVALPEGLIGKLAGVPYCPDAALAAVSGVAGTGSDQVAAPSCPSASRVGTVIVGAGAGSSPFYVDTGKAYLAGPYKGAQISLAVIAPAVAGPFDLGSVVVRNALHVDPTTAQITAVSDPLPTILHGIPLDLRDIRVEIDRPDFTLNPTSCDPMAITSTIYSAQGATANPRSRFQAAACERLAFKPKLDLRFFGETHRSAYPRLKATLTMSKNGANASKATVLMPKTELLEQNHIRTLCTRDQWASDSCPKASIYGKAKAFTPLLDKPLEGNVYLRSNGGARELPDLVADLKGQIDIELVGYIDAVNARLRARFLNVPDAPVSKFVLEMQGGKKGLLAHNTDVCRTKPRASVKFDGQNGKVHDFNSVVKVSCGKK